MNYGFFASMRPRLIAVDDFSRAAALTQTSPASMRPRLIAVDDVRAQHRGVRRPAASMRPRLIAVDDPRSGRFLTTDRKLQ